jgi:hypothetical protein
MQLLVILLLAAVLWACGLSGAISLCRAAKAGDEQMKADGEGSDTRGGREASGSSQARRRIEDAAGTFDLDVHPRPTRSKPRTQPDSGSEERGTEPHPESAERSALDPPGRSPQARTGAPTMVAAVTDAPLMQREALSLHEAARALGVSADVVLAWEARYGYPKSHRAAAGHDRTYSRAEVLALSEALKTGLSIPSAMNAAQAFNRRQRASARRASKLRRESQGDQS